MNFDLHVERLRTSAEMAREGEFRQRAVTTANLLLEAASMLQRPGTERQRTVTSPVTGPSSALTGQRTVTSPATGPSFALTGPSPSSELRGLFNWKPRSGSKRKCKYRGDTAISGSAKKAKVSTWTHTWVCLSRVADDAVPDATDRVKLKLAGLGERRFTTDANSTAQELYYELEFQFPKLKDSGGFELMRMVEGSQRELEVIEMPASGYTCDFLKAVVHNAKLYIRPLQSDLSLDQCHPNVSLRCTHNITK